MFINKVPISFQSVTQKFVMLSVKEAKIAEVVMVAQDILYKYRLLESIGFNIEMPMLLEMDNWGAVDIANSWSVGFRTHHMGIQNCFLHEQKDQGKVIMKHIPGDTNDAEIFTKNIESAVFNCHVPLYVGQDEYINMSDKR